MLLTIVSFVFVFTVITLVHEFGHLYFSKKAGIAVYEFGVGFGPTLFEFQHSGTTYKINALPILGYVKIAGIDTDDPKEKETAEDQKYYSKPIFSKFFSIFSGPAMNLLFGFIVFSLVFAFTGAPRGVSNEIATISPGSEAAKIGLKPGDRLESLGGNKVVDPEKAIALIHKSPGKPLRLSVTRSGKEIAFVATPQYNKNMKIGLIGFSLRSIYRRVNPIEAVWLGLKETAGLCFVVTLVLGKLFIGRLSLGGLAGPVGIAQITGQYAQHGLVSLLSFMAFFSINVAVLNLLPLPALDGGRLFFILLEAIRRKPISIEKENRVHGFGMMVLLGLLAVLTINDLIRIFRQ